ncbi:hypothetical protein P8452_29955 [Trifolium repens]|nr:hypothetical protein QL285_097435 [Trifolium repens]WJX42760.1 hypothetical protein P8452_29955 [Trifolium repens]
MENHETTYPQDDVDAAIVFAVEEAIGQKTPSDEIFKIAKENSLVKHVLSCKSVEEIAARYQEMVEMQKCLPLEDLYGEKTDAAHTVEDKTLEDAADQGTGTYRRSGSTRAGNQKLAEHPKPWSVEEKKALVYLVNKYEGLDMTVTEVFNEVKSRMSADHVLYSRSAEALATHYRKMLKDEKCPALRGSLNTGKKGGGHAGRSGFGEGRRTDAVSVGRRTVAASAGAGRRTVSGRVNEDFAAGGKKSVEVGGAGRRTVSGRVNEDFAAGGKKSVEVGDVLAAIEIIFDYFTEKFVMKTGGVISKTKKDEE